MGGWAIAVHGGAGVDPNLPQHRQEEAKQVLARCLEIGISALRSSLPAVDVVELVVRANSLTLSLYVFLTCNADSDEMCTRYLVIMDYLCPVSCRFFFSFFSLNVKR